MTPALLKSFFAMGKASSWGGKGRGGIKCLRSVRLDFSFCQLGSAV